MNRTALFVLAIVAGIVFAIVAVLFWAGAFGHTHGEPGGLNHFKHGLLFIGLAVLAFVFAAATRPRRALTSSQN